MKINIYSEYLDELDVLERRPKKKAIEEWKNKVEGSLDGNQRIRFSRLKFFDDVADFSDDIPF